MGITIAHDETKKMKKRTYFCYDIYNGIFCSTLKLLCYEP